MDPGRLLSSAATASNGDDLAWSRGDVAPGGGDHQTTLSPPSWSPCWSGYIAGVVRWHKTLSIPGGVCAPPGLSNSACSASWHQRCGEVPPLVLVFSIVVITAGRWLPARKCENAESGLLICGRRMLHNALRLLGLYPPAADGIAAARVSAISVGTQNQLAHVG